MTSDAAATDAVVAKEIARLRMKDRESKVIVCLPAGSTIAHVVYSTAQPLRFPIISWKLRPRKLRQRKIKRPELLRA
jgi:hypothetical protein